MRKYGTSPAVDADGRAYVTMPGVSDEKQDAEALRRYLAGETCLGIASALGLPSAREAHEAVRREIRRRGHGTSQPAVAEMRHVMAMAVAQLKEACMVTERDVNREILLTDADIAIDRLREIAKGTHYLAGKDGSLVTHPETGELVPDPGPNLRALTEIREWIQQKAVLLGLIPPRPVIVEEKKPPGEGDGSQTAA